MSIKVTTNDIAKSIKIPSSKSYANRALILGALSPKKITISNLPLAQDVEDMISVFEKLFIAKRISKQEVVLFGQFNKDVISEKRIELNFGEGGTTIRFLLPLIATSKQEFLIKVHPNFKKRPYKKLLNILSSNGAQVSEVDDKETLCVIKGPINFKNIDIDCSETSQVASAFIMLSSYHSFELQLVNLEASSSYIELTKGMLGHFKQNNKFSVPMDFSCASYFIALGAIKSSLTISNLKEVDSLQADSKIFKVLDLMGVSYRLGSLGLEIDKCFKPKAFSFDVKDCLDLTPTLAFLASFCDGVSVISGINNLIYKESNRINAIKLVLESFGITFKIKDNQFFIEGAEEIRDITEIEVAYDHRVVMMAAMFAKMTHSGVNIRPAEAVKKSFANFFELLS